MPGQKVPIPRFRDPRVHGGGQSRDTVQGRSVGDRRDTDHSVDLAGAIQVLGPLTGQDTALTVANEIGLYRACRKQKR